MIYIHLKYQHQNGAEAKLKTSEPSGSALWPDLLCYRTFAVVHDSGMSSALHVRPKNACNFSSVYIRKNIIMLFCAGRLDQAVRHESLGIIKIKIHQVIISNLLFK